MEVIEPGSVSADDFKKWDVKALVEHNKQRMLARSFHGAGTLSLNVDEYGVKYRYTAPNIQEGEYVVEMIRRGDMFGSSFAYITDEKRNVTYERKDDGMLIRRVHKIDRIFDVSVVSDPAFMGTDVNVRSLESYFEDEKQVENRMEIIELRNLIND